MPKQTFFNLPKEKRDAILEAARQEFSEVTLQKASIAHIIKRAVIPRGSFYQYFEDKDDIFFYLVESTGERFLENLIQALENEKGDIFKACEVWFKQTMDVLEDPLVRKFCNNIFLSMNEKMQDHITTHHTHNPFAATMQIMKQKVDFSLLATEDAEEIGYLLKMIRGVVFSSMAEYLKGNMDKEKCLRAYTFKMEIIKRGIYK